MLPIRRILVPVNFTNACRNAARFAVDLASDCAADVCIIHVLEPVGYATGFESANMFDEGVQAQRQVACRELQAFPDPELSRPVERTMLEGDPATQIIRFAHNHQIDLILMPTRGYSIVRRLLLGSVTAKVLHDAECPVWTGVHPEPVGPEGSMRVRRVACAVDLGPQTRSALSWAGHFAAHWHAGLDLIHVLAPLQDETWRDQMTGMAREQLAAQQSEAGIDGAELHIECGKARARVPEIARRIEADLLVIGRGHLGASGRLGGSAYAIVRDSTCPVVSV